MGIQILLLIIGFVLLVKGADWFVDGAAGVAGKARIPQLIIGLTVVAFGTSAPELAVSLSSALKSSEGVAIGNVIGSNITNILLILGISAVFKALPVQKNLRHFDFPVLLGASALFILFGDTNQKIETWEGIVLAAGLMLYTAFLIVSALRERANDGDMSALNDENQTEEPDNKLAAWYENMKEKLWFLIIITIVGLALVVWGADIAVNAATEIAKYLGVGENIIGLTVVAIGTSLPELVTSVTAARKGETDIAVGNIIGSNIFNILMVAGLSAAIMPLTFESAFIIDAIIAFAAAAVLAVLGYLKGNEIRRTGGIIFLVGFVAYYVYLFINAGVFA